MPTNNSEGSLSSCCEKVPSMIAAREQGTDLASPSFWRDWVVCSCRAAIRRRCSASATSTSS
eukprot:2000511-Pyramimonas_sp.AAC.1